MPNNLDPATRLTNTTDSLAGLSVGDALGAQYFVPGTNVADLIAGRLPAGPWPWTDDTEMAANLVAELLAGHGSPLDQDRLASSFAYRSDAYRGYGAGAVVILHQIRDGVPWSAAAGAAFNGEGSCGNGAAMRVAPLGAYHADDPDLAIAQAIRSAEVTHRHPEGIAGAVAVALAAGIAASARHSGTRPTPAEFLAAVLDHLAPGDTRTGIERAVRLLDVTAAEAAHELGNGSRETAQETVPFTLWVAAQHLADYPTAVTTCVAAGGDVDTTAAIAGGIVAAYTGATQDRPGVRGVPAAWLAAREPLPDWVWPPETNR